VIYTALSDLKWDAEPGNYKVIFIAGNEDFLQGSLHWTKACAAAKDKGVIINTIYCGDKEQGIREHWNLGTECGSGSYTHIDQNAKTEDIATPYDSILFVLNTRLNNTYISYGYRGVSAAAKQEAMDVANYQTNKSAAVKRITVKGTKSSYRNADWDLVDAYESDSTIIAKVDLKTLPLSLQGKSRKEILSMVQQKSTERGAIQKEIVTLSSSRDSFIVKERARNIASTNATLETEVEKIIRSQAQAYNITFK
jgi:hypothetical protein